MAQSSIPIKKPPQMPERPSPSLRTIENCTDRRASLAHKQKPPNHLRNSHPITVENARIRQVLPTEPRRITVAHCPSYKCHSNPSTMCMDHRRGQESPGAKDTKGYAERHGMGKESSDINVTARGEGRMESSEGARIGGGSTSEGECLG